MRARLSVAASSSVASASSSSAYELEHASSAPMDAWLSHRESERAQQQRGEGVTQADSYSSRVAATFPPVKAPASAYAKSESVPKDRSTASSPFSSNAAAKSGPTYPTPSATPSPEKYARTNLSRPLCWRHGQGLVAYTRAHVHKQERVPSRLSRHLRRALDLACIR